VPEVLAAPANNGDLGIALNPRTGGGRYLVTYGVYICTNISCVYREDVRGLLIDSVTFARVPWPNSASYVTIAGWYGIQWAARPIFDSVQDQYVVFYNDNRLVETDFTTYAQRVTPQGYLTGGTLGQQVVADTGSQRWPEVAYLQFAAPMPRYFLVWEDEPSPAVPVARGAFLSSGILRDWGTIDLSSEAGTYQSRPQLSATNGPVPSLTIVWQHARPYQSPDIHGLQLSASDFNPVAALSPVDWTMVLSLRPEFWWGSVEGADRYNIRLHHSTNALGVGEELQPVLGLSAESTVDPTDPTTNLYRLDRDLHSGPTPAEGGYYWWIEAVAATGETLAVSRPEAFQIPPLGRWEDMVQAYPGLPADNPHWNQYDDLIYYWSEVRDIPPDLVKAIIVGETGSKLAIRRRSPPTGYPGSAIGFEYGFSPLRAYLYEPSLDWIAFDSPRGVCRPDWSEADCARWRQAADLTSVRFYAQPGNPPFACGEGMTIEECASLARDQGLPYPYDDARGGFDYYDPFTITKFLRPFGFGYSNPNHLEWMEDLGYDIDRNYQDGGAAYAQYRTVASYGLGQVVFLGGKSRWLGNSLNDLVPPEMLYDANLNLRVATRLLGHSRCWQIDEFGLPYVGAEDGEWDSWYWPIFDYAGNARRVDSAEAYYVLSHPVSLAGENVGTIWEDFTDELPDAFVEAVNQTVCPDASHASGGGQGITLISRTLQTDPEEEVARGVVDLKGTGNEVLVVASATVPSETSPFRKGIIRLYGDDTEGVVAWELETHRPVEPIVMLTLHPGSGNRPAMLQVDWLVGAHGIETYFIYWNEMEYGVVPIVTNDDPDHDGGVASSGGGVQMEPDGSIVVFQRGEDSLDEFLGDVYKFDVGDGYSFARTFEVDLRVQDSTPPLSGLETDPPENELGWNRSPVVVRVISQDETDVRRTSVGWSNADGSGSGQLVVPETEAEFLLTEGTWTIGFNATDVYGNTATEQAVAIEADGTGPATEVQLDGSIGPGGEYTTPVLVTLAASDPTLADGSDASGVESVEFLVGEGGTWEAYEGPFEIAGDGHFTIQYRAIDRAGNVGPQGTVEFDIASGTALNRVADFVLLGMEGVWVEQNAVVATGDIAANVASPGPYLAEGSEVIIGIGAAVVDPESRVMGDSVYLKNGSQVHDVYYNELQGLGVVLGNAETPLALPIVGALPDVPTFSPGTQDFDVPQNGSLTIDAGAYGLLKARLGSTITFTGGVYDFSEWDVGDDVEVYFQAPAEIRVAGRLSVDQGSYLGPEPGVSGLDARDIVIYVNGRNGNTGGVGATPKAAKFGISTEIHANVYAPNGTLWLRQNGRFTGAFLARWVDLGIGAEATLVSQWTEGGGN